MTNEQKRKQITALFGAYSKRLEKLYDNFIGRLSQLITNTHALKDTLTQDPLFHFKDFPEIHEEYNRIFADYVKNEMLAYRSGITDGVALAYSHNTSVLTGFSVLSDKAITSARNTAAETFIRSRLQSTEGLNLSQLVWNYAQQARSEFEVAVSNVISDGLKKGTSAEALGRAVRQYLNNPDMMYRRYHRTVVDAHGNKKDIVKWRKRIIDENGKIRFVEQPLEKVGMGHYRSARKNSNRLMRTEINMSYHRANSERWQNEPFVIGIAIDLSPQHPAPDECDDLQGRYPKDFVFIGWHPQCLCMANPITIQGEEKDDFYRRLAAGEDMSDWHSKYEVKDIPEKAKKWIEANKDKFIRAGERGKLGYVWRENMKYVGKQFTPEQLAKMGYEPTKIGRAKRIKTDAEKADIQKRWDERKRKNELIVKTGKNVWSVADSLAYKETIGMKAELRDAIIKGDTVSINSASRSLAKEIAKINKVSKQYGEYIPNIKTHLQSLTTAELQPVYEGILKKIQFIEGKFPNDLFKQYEKYLWEAKDYLGGNLYGVQQKYASTWKISQEAYYALADKAKLAYDWKQVENALTGLKTFQTKSSVFKGYIADLDSLVSSKTELAKAQDIVAKAESKRIKLTNKRVPKATGSALTPLSDEEALKLVEAFKNEYGNVMDDLLRKETEQLWANLSDAEKVVLTKYTQSYSYLNEPLRGIRYGGVRSWAEFEKDMPILTDAIDKMKATENFVVRRGTSNFEIKGLGKYLSDLKPGDEFIDGGFLSTSVHVRKGFFESYNMYIVVPKNARGIYAEPFSHYTDFNMFEFDGKLWDGLTKESMGCEREWIGQRGAKFRVIKKEGDDIYLQIVSQKNDLFPDYQQFFY